MTIITKRNKIAATAGAAFIIGITGLTYGGIQTANAQQTRRPYQNERQPRINEAIQSLEQVRTDLRRANRDFGGHRAKAADHVDKALVELRKAKLYDDTHGPRK